MSLIEGRAVKAISMSRIWLRARHSAVSLWRDHNGIAATEFAMIVPLMLVMFFGTVEFSSGLAVDRKVTLIARTLSDLTSQSPNQQLTDAYLQNVFTASISIAYPYPPVPTQAKVSQIYVDSNNKATIQWSEAAIIAGNTATQATLTASTHSPGDDVTPQVPPALLVKKTFLIWSEVSYLYTPAVGYVMVNGVKLSDFTYSRPRKYTCLYYQTFGPTFTPTPPATGCPVP
jgi:Flp pilus assembly protein TadG